MKKWTLAKRVAFITACIVLPGGCIIAIAYMVDHYWPRPIEADQLREFV